MSIEIARPLKDCLFIAGMRQEGKTNLLANLLNSTFNPYTLFDTMGVFTKARFKPLKPDIQRIVKPAFSMKESVFKQTCNEVWNEGNQIFAIEEVGQFCSPHFLPPELDSLVNLGGNRNIALWVTTRRVSEVHGDIIGNCHYHFIFKVYLPRDVDYYKSYIGNVVEMAKDIPKFHFIYYKLGGMAKLYKPVKKLL